MTVILVCVGAISLKAALEEEEEELVPPVSSGPVAEEVDIFKERAREMARQERREAKKKDKKKPPPTVSNWYKFSHTAPSEVGDGFGMINRGSHLIGKTFGRFDSMTPLEAMPYILTDEHFFFSDVRGFVTNHSEGGGNIGAGYRNIREDWNAWGGASVWYDGDMSTSRYFQQVGLSFEGLIQRFEFRSNVYVPIASTSQQISNTVGSAAIVGNQLLYGRSITQGYALNGVDFEAGYSLPVRERHVVRGFVGGYHFEGSSNSNVNGFKLRIEGVYNNGPQAQVLYTSDNLYGDNLMVGITLNFPFGNNHPTSGWKQHTPSPFRFVERNYNVIVDQQQSNLSNQVAVDPSTGNPYVVDQVYAPPPGTLVSPATAPNGTAENPYSSVAAAQAAGGNLIIVQGGSVLSDPVTLTAGQHLLGQGNYVENLPVAGGGTVRLPNLLQAAEPGNPSQTPIFSGVTGTAVTLASNTEVAGFVFSGTSAGGIAGTNVDNATIHDLKFISTTGDSIHLTDSSGLISFYNVQINGSTADGIVMDGGNANINYNGTGTSITTQGDGFVLENVTGGTVNIGNLWANGTGGVGLKMATVGTDVTIGSFKATGTTGAAVAISGDTGQVETVNGVSTNVFNTYTFSNFTTITSPKGSGFTINGTDAIITVGNLNVTSTAGSPAVSLVNNPSSAVTFGTLTLNTNNGTALSAVGMADLVVNQGTITSVGAPAINIQNSAINATFGSVSANGGSVGINLAQDTGFLTIKGNGSLGSGGTIQNTTTGLAIDSAGTTTINYMNFASNGTAVKSTESSQLVMAGLQIAGSTGYAIQSNDDATIVLSNSTLANNGAIGGGTILVQADTIGTFQSQFSGNTISDAHGVAIQYATTATGAGASLASTVSSNTLTGANGGSAIIGVNWNGPVSFAANNNVIDALGSAMTAILVQDTSLTQSLALTASANAITFEAGATQGTGVSVIAANTSQLSVAENTIDFLATGGIGERYALSGTSTDFIASNIITDQAGGATGLLFDTVAANSRLQIDGNTINLLASDLTTHQGIIFTQVTPTIQFAGSINNLIYNTTSLQTLFSIPVNSATGGFYINGSLVQ